MGFMVQLAKEHDELACAAVFAEAGKEEVFLASCFEILFKKYAI